MALTDIKVRAAKPTDKQYKLTDGGGMHLLVHPNGSKYWRLAASPYRPAKLALPPDQAAEKLRFRRSANSLTLINPTPYYLTVTELNAGTRVLENALVPPMGESTVKLPSDAGSNITYRTINDYGALTPKMTGVME